jgi:hypothetical protein
MDVPTSGVLFVKTESSFYHLDFDAHTGARFHDGEQVLRRDGQPFQMLSVREPIEIDQPLVMLIVVQDGVLTLRTTTLVQVVATPLTDHPHGVAQAPTKHERRIVDDTLGAEITVSYYVAICTCGQDFVASTKDSAWSQLANHAVETAGGLRDLLRDSGIVSMGPVEVFETGGPDDHD